MTPGLGTFVKGILKRHRFLISAVLMGFCAAVLSFTILSSYVKTAPVVVAQRDIEQYSRIGPKDVKVVEMPLKAILPSSFTRIQDVLGTYAISRLCQGQIICEGHVMSGRDEIGISFDLPEGKRGILIPVTPEKALGGFIKEGDHVDITWVPDSKNISSIQGLEGAVTVLHNARVIKITLDPSSNEIDGVIIQTSPDVCEKMAYYVESGSLYLSLVPKSEGSDSGSHNVSEGGVLP